MRNSTLSDSSTSKGYLTFELLEDVMLMRPAEYRKIVESVELLRIGPIVEYAYHHYHDLAPPFQPRCELGSYFQDSLQAIKVNAVKSNSSVRAKQVEFFRPPESMEDAESVNWLRFCRRLADAALQAHLPKDFSYALAGTFEEMTGNMIEHSARAETGLVGYRWRPGEFEYVVVDAGVGVLHSLRTHTDFAWIADSGEALELAVSDGVSRFGFESHRGTGFHDLVFNIAHRNSYLRFRSGDHVYVVDGTQGFPRKLLQPCSDFPGLLISVICRAGDFR